MIPGGDPIEGLRAALRLSPENLPLRLAVARALLGIGRYAEAEREFLDALAVAPRDPELQLGLAHAYLQQDKLSPALVVVEDLVRRQAGGAAVHLLYARLLARRGDIPRAVAQYKLALEFDPAVADPLLGEELGLEEAESEEVDDGRVRVSNLPDHDHPRTDLERPSLKFADVGGLQALKEEIGMKIIYPLQHPEMYMAYGKTIGGGILMYGPPGCGKTYLARATAGEIQANFLAVGINDILEMWLGNSERNLHDIFEQARRSRPCVLFFDEVDALGGRRSDMHGGAGRNVINLFLSELDGVSGNNEGVLVLAATNAPWHVDPAFRRPGRFDRVLFVPPPDAPGRSAILRLHCQGKPMELLDFDQVTRKTEGFSGADLKAVVDVAVESKLREAFRAGRPLPLTTNDLLEAAKSLRPTSGEWFATARNHALYANQGGAYDDVLKYLKL